MATPEQPKKVTGGAFGRFLMANRAALTAECKGKPACEVTKLAGARWKAMGNSEKATYEEQYKKAMQQYEKDMEAFSAAGGEKKVLVRKGAPEKPAKKEKDPECPKKPVGGAYGIFQNEKREEFVKACTAKGETGFGPVAKMTSEMFKALGEAERAGYEAKYNEKVAAYKVAIAAYSEKKAAEEPAAAADTSSPPAKRGRKAASPAGEAEN